MARIAPGGNTDSDLSDGKDGMARRFETAHEINARATWNPTIPLSMADSSLDFDHRAMLHFTHSNRALGKSTTFISMTISRHLGILILTAFISTARGGDDKATDAGSGLPQIVQPLPGQIVRALPGQIVRPLRGQVVRSLRGQLVPLLRGQNVQSWPGQMIPGTRPR